MNERSKKPKSRKTVVTETHLGLYLWQLPDGGLLADDEGNFLNIPAYKGDIKRMMTITNAAKSMGYDGNPIWYEGSMRISDEEFYRQIDRMVQGLVPNELDIGSYKDDIGRGRK